MNKGVKYEVSQNQFQMNPIGTIDKEHIINVNSKFNKGLKYLSMFSHAILIYKNGENSNILNTNLCQKTVLLKEVHEYQGKIIVEGLDKFDRESLLYDIKPYFPNEDRVKDAVVFEERNYKFLLKNSVSQLGVIRKQAGQYYIEINKCFEDYADILKDYSHIKIVWWFHKFETDKYRRILECDPPYENAPVFASRSPVRPNPIAITTAKILDIDEDMKRIKVSALDCFDKTTCLGISPYVPDRDCVVEYRLPNWLNHWPEWLDDSEFTIMHEPILLIADSHKFEKYIDQSRKNISTRISFDEATLQPVSHKGIMIKGARQNNLKNIDVMIPYHKITVITGVSGSGKSSLAFETIYAESQQRFLASMSLSRRNHFLQLEKPDCDQIIGLPPAIAISQQNNNRNPRSTVGTVTDINSLLRTLFANIGMRHCPKCGRSIEKLSFEEILQLLSCCRAGTSLKIKPIFEKEYEKSIIVLDKRNEQYDDDIQLLETQVKKCLQYGKGAIQVLVDDDDDLLTLQTTEKCYDCNHILFELTPADFSFNHPESMCPVCRGLGVIMDVDVKRIVQYPNLSILDGASLFWGKLRKFQKNPNANWMKGEVLALAELLNVNLELPWNDLPEIFKKQVIYGTGNDKVTWRYTGTHGRTNSICRPVEGAYYILKRLSQNREGISQKSMITHFLTSQLCHCCHGERLKLESRLVTVGNKRFPEVIQMNMDEMNNWIMNLPEQIHLHEIELVNPLLKEIHIKLMHCIKIGVGYLTSDRSIPSLSGGEWQRLQLGSQLNTGLSHILYILDEPTAGLHPKDYALLLEIIESLKKLNNTIIMVEHNRDMMLAADHIIDIGPKAGTMGGYLTAQGSPQEILKSSQSQLGKYLCGQKNITRSTASSLNHWVDIKKINGNNLQNIHITFPLNALTCITGVSGSGKSSLINYGIIPSVHSVIENSIDKNRYYESITGGDSIRRMVHITQKPIGRSSRSTPATYTGLMDEIRMLFSKTEMAKIRNYSMSHFSYNSKEGQCPACHGYGYKTIEVPFMPEMKTKCSMCKGKKFHSPILQILYKGKNISQILDFSMEEALLFFLEHKKISQIIQSFIDIGLGYISLGQSSLTLSGGEAQRIKLAAELQMPNPQHTLYLLDEPSTGLHISDIQKLINIFDRLISKGHTIILVEHHLDVIKNADWIIDMGPEGGEKGGNVNVQGTVYDVQQCSQSYTGQLLKQCYIDENI